jgi:hypothetical protein
MSSALGVIRGLLRWPQWRAGAFPAEAPPDQAAKAVLESAFSPVAAIRPLRDALPGLVPGGRQLLVHRNLPRDAQAADLPRAGMGLAG